MPDCDVPSDAAKWYNTLQMNERVEYPNAVMCERGYDVMDRVAEIAWSGYDGADADSRTYAYDNADNIVSIATADGETIDYVYDGIDRLAGVSVDGAAVAEYAYDVLGNLVAVANGEESFEILVDGGHSLADVTSDGTPLRLLLSLLGVLEAPRGSCRGTVSFA